MQIAGRPCAVCERIVSSILLGVACPSCNLVFHTACLPTVELCLKCQRPFQQTMAQAEDDADRAREVVASRRSRVQWAATSLFMMAFVAVSAPSTFELLHRYARIEERHRSAFADMIVKDGVLDLALGIFCMVFTWLVPDFSLFRRSVLGRQQTRTFAVLLSVYWLARGSAVLAQLP